MQMSKSAFKGHVNNSTDGENVECSRFHAIKSINNSATCSIIPVFWFTNPNSKLSIFHSGFGADSLSLSLHFVGSILFICASISKYATIDKLCGFCDLRCPETYRESEREGGFM